MPGLREGLFFDDVMILPRHSEVTAAETTVESRLSSSIVLHVPFISSARQKGADYRLALTIARAGGMGCIPLFAHVEDQAHEVRKVKELLCHDKKSACDAKGRPVVGALIDLERPGLSEWVGSLAEVAADVLIVETPQADRLSVLHRIEEVKREYDWMPVMIGNVQTRAGAKDVIDAGADIVVVGSGVTSFTEATEVSGIGVPELSALMEVEDVASLYDKPIVCNMDVHTPASVIKALAGGAAAVIFNNMTPETATAMAAQMEDQLRRSLSYIGVHSIPELQEKAEFIRVHAPGNS